jgi:alpha-D-ribose 1-methylphosphonate 5-triphosphate diphosphatase PhnM
MPRVQCISRRTKVLKISWGSGKASEAQNTAVINSGVFTQCVALALGNDGGNGTDQTKPIRN